MTNYVTYYILQAIGENFIMLSLPFTLDDPQLMKKDFAFELIDESRHRTFLESCLDTEDRIQSALAGWVFEDIPHAYNLTRVIKRLSDDAYVCYVAAALLPKNGTYTLLQGGRIAPPALRDRGVLTKAIADEGIDYFFCRFPWIIDEIEIWLPPGYDMSKRAKKVPTSNQESKPGGYSKVVWTRERYL
ncbi:MAG: hypothetical protein DWQ49_06385 [Bacteroidetes bacterium]|nr:MAG: hypothetical protein DWQ49_06385 [Bacteroidota bacterium]